MKTVTPKFVLMAIALAVTTAQTGCRPSYAMPVVVAVPGEGDVAWIIEDRGHVLRCVNSVPRPHCLRADVD